MQFEIRALKASEGVISLAIDAADEASALEQARAQGLAVLSARRRQTFTLFNRQLRARFPLLLFSQELVALLQAGLSLPETMETMAEKETRPDTRKALAMVRNRLFEGRSL